MTPAPCSRISARSSSEDLSGRSLARSSAGIVFLRVRVQDSLYHCARPSCPSSFRAPRRDRRSLSFRRARLPRLTTTAVCYVSRKPWILLEAEIAQGLPKTYCPLMFVLDQRRQSCGAL